VKKFCIVVNFYIWIVIKNYWWDIKNEKIENFFDVDEWWKIYKKKKKTHE
jgi:hypothetical protein